MPTAAFALYPKFQAFDSNGDPLTGGLLFTYAPGTTTKQSTYTTPAGSVANANPTVLDSRGEANVCLDASKLYKFVLAPATDADPPVNAIWTVDNVGSNSSGIYYLPSGSGATARLLQTKVREIAVSITDFGAVADDSTDNSTAITSANTAVDGVGGITWIPPAALPYRYATGFTVPAGVSMVGAGTGALGSVLKYSGSLVAITTEDIYPTESGTIFKDFQLTTTTTSPSVGPGTHGIRIANGTFITLDGVKVRGFSTAGVEMQSTSGKAVQHVNIINNTRIIENTTGLLASGVNAATNGVSIIGSSIRANIQWNVYSELDVRAWSLTGGSNFEAGATGNVSGGGVSLRQVQGLSINGCYFEQTTVFSAIDIADSNAAGGISITGNLIQGPGTGTAIKLGTSAICYGVNVSGNVITGWSVGVDPGAVVGGVIGPNRYVSIGTSEVDTPASTSASLTIISSTDVKVYGGPSSNYQYDGSAWSAAPKLKYPVIPLGGVAFGSLGTNTTPVAGTIYVTEIYIDRPKTLTGIGILNGSAAADNVIYALYSIAGVLLKNTALAGTAMSGTNAFQEIAFDGGTYAALPGKYLLALQVNGTTGRFRSIAASTYIDVRTISQAGVFATLAAISPLPTANVADVGPIGYLYG